MMATFLSLAMLVAPLVPAVFSLGLGLGGGLDLGGGLGLHLPPLNLGLSVDLLIDAQTVSELLAASYDPQEMIQDCEIPHHHTSGTSHIRNVLSGDGRWYLMTNDGTYLVPIVIDPAFNKSEVEQIYAGMYDIQNGTCVRLVVYNDETILINGGYDYVRIEREANKDCYSEEIGRAGKGKQIVNLQPKACDRCGHCIWPGIAAHELLHAIGFEHQHVAPGRDRYVSIQWRNIKEGKKSYFEEVSPANYSAYGAPYDYDSVMHYLKDDFSRNGQDTIITLNGAAIGQRKGLSQWDRYKVNKMYECPT